MVIDVIAQRLADTRDRFVLSSEHCRNDVRLRLTHEIDLPGLRCVDPAADSPAGDYVRSPSHRGGRHGPSMRGADQRPRAISISQDLASRRLIVEVDGRGKYRTVRTSSMKFHGMPAGAGYGFLRSLGRGSVRGP